MRRLLIIGIGTGDPRHLTLQAVDALQQVDVFFLMDKGTQKAGLLDLRRELCARHAREGAYRIVEVADPVRDARVPAYEARVEAWHEARVVLLEQLLARELADGQCGAFLVWGDPSLYDSTLRIVDALCARGELPLAYEVIPGLSSVQVLAARHRVALNRIGGEVHLTTGRRLEEGRAGAHDDTVVMLDGRCAFQHLVQDDFDIFWGAYLGSEAELLISGPLTEVAQQIVEARARARSQHGWIMDTYLLRRRRRREPVA